MSTLPNRVTACPAPSQPLSIAPGNSRDRRGSQPIANSLTTFMTPPVSQFNMLEIVPTTPEEEFRCQRRNSGPGRPGWSPTQAPHRSGLAHHAHPVPHLMNSRPARSVVVTWTWFRSQCTWHVSLQRLMRRHLLSGGALARAL